MKIIYVDSEEYQLGMSIPYHLDRTIKVGDSVATESLWNANPLHTTIKRIEIRDHYIFLFLE